MLKEENSSHEKGVNSNIGLADDNIRSIDFMSCYVLSQNDMDKTKLLLIKKINEIIAIHNLNQKDAAKLLEIDQPKISQMKNNKIAGFSLERLFRFFTKLGWKIKLTLDRG